MSQHDASRCERCLERERCAHELESRSASYERMRATNVRDEGRERDRMMRVESQACANLVRTLPCPLAASEPAGMHKRADGTDCPYLAEDVCNKCGWCAPSEPVCTTCGGKRWVSDGYDGEDCPDCATPKPDDARLTEQDMAAIADDAMAESRRIAAAALRRAADTLAKMGCLRSEDHGMRTAVSELRAMAADEEKGGE